MSFWKFCSSYKAPVVAAMVSVAMPLLAHALSLDDAKARGLVGETPSGYLGIVEASKDSAAIGLQQDINQKRRQKYQEIAEKNGTPLSAVEQLAGKKAIESTGPGNFVQLPSGQWLRK